MKGIFNNSAEIEQKAKDSLEFPPYVMMENAALALKNLILSSCENLPVIIICGKGNNGADGYALARLLKEERNVSLFMAQEPSSTEAKTWSNICCKLKIPLLTPTQLEKISTESQKYIVVDCLFGTGFRGQADEQTCKLIHLMNTIPGTKIACDIPSALLFKADYTLTMGTHKLVLFSDKAKNVCGKIITAPIALPSTFWEENFEPCAYYLEENDMHLPLRKSRLTHKGNFGHTAVFCAEKSGASIIAATAAGAFGSGLTSLIKTLQSNLNQFKISPELMISSSIPKKTTAIVIGPGMENLTEKENLEILQWFMQTKNPALVMDAGIFNYKDCVPFLQKLNSVKEGKIILTPHLSELERLLQKVLISFNDCGLKEKEITTKALSESTEAKIKAGKILNQLFPNTIIIMKSANTFICGENKCFIVTQGCQNLSKGGSGDVLAGLCGSLLAQGYSVLDAAISATMAHAFASRNAGEERYDLEPYKLIEEIRALGKLAL